MRDKEYINKKIDSLENTIKKIDFIVSRPINIIELKKEIIIALDQVNELKDTIERNTTNLRYG
jgi:hypothetical protein